MSLDSDYPYINTDTNSQNNGYQYTLHPNTGGAWHVYQPGAPVHQVWVPGPSNVGNVSAAAFRASVTIPSPPPAPIAAAPAPAPAPAPPPTVITPKTSGAVPSAPSWNPNAPASNIYVNTSGKEYQVQDASGIGEWHVYKDQKPVWVAGPSWEQTNMTPEQYNKAHLPTATPIPVPNPPAPVSNGTGGTAAPPAPANNGTGGTPAPGPTPLQKAQQEAHPFGGGTAAPTVTNSFAQPTSGGSSDGGANHVVIHGDTMSKIAESNGMPLSQLEALNPQIKDPSLIFPGQSLNLGGNNSTASNTGGSTAAPTPASSVTGGNPAVASAGFPTSSTYQSSGSNSQDSPVKIGNFGDKPSGWATNGTAGVPADPAKGAVSVDTHQNTNPLHINDKNQKNTTS